MKIGTAPITTVTADDLDNQRPRPLHDLLDRLADKADKGSEGLPVGVQVVALPWQDETALRVMRELEVLHPFTEAKEKRAQWIKEVYLKE